MVAMTTHDVTSAAHVSALSDWSDFQQNDINDRQRLQQLE